VIKRISTHDGQPVRRQLVATFAGPGYRADREDTTLHISWSPPDDDIGEIRLIASFEGFSYVAENEEGGELAVYLLTSEPVNTSTLGDTAPHGVVLGLPRGPKTTAAMRKGRPMTGERLQAINEAARRGERPPAVRDRTPNPVAVEMQRRNETTRDQ